MTHTDTRQAIREIMESLGENIECDQLINKLVDRDIITRDDVCRINRVEDKDKMKELLLVVLGKDPELHPLALKILENLQQKPSQQNTRSTDLAIEQASPGARAVDKPLTEKRMLTNAEVSQDWPLKHFLYDLSKEIGTEEFHDMKDLMHGENGFKASALEKIKRPMQFFQQLMHTGRLNAYNLHFLQALVRRIGRKDLNERVREFCLESHKQPIHFFTPSDTPENGYRFVKHHIEGDIERLTHVEKERLRAEVADIICVPPAFVFIKGIEPSDSLLFTFMVPEEDVSSFIHMYVAGGASMIHLSVHIQIDEEQLSMSEIPPSPEKDHTPMFEQLMNLLKTEKRLKGQLEERDEKLLDLQTELDSKEEDTTVDQVLHGEDVEEDSQDELFKSLFYRMMEVMKTMQPKENKNGATGVLGSLKLSSAYALHRDLLQQIKSHISVSDINLVNQLLDTGALIENTLHEERLKNMQSIIEMLVQRVEEMSEMRMSSSIVGGSSTFLQDVLAIQGHARQLAIEQHKEGPQKIEINGIIGLHVIPRIYQGPRQFVLRQEHQHLLMEMTKDLSAKDRKKLKNFLCFSEAEKEMLERDPNKLLELAFLRELHNGRLEEPMENILGGILAKISKGQLIQKYFPETVPKITSRPSVEKKKSKRQARSETPQRRRPDSETGTETSR